MKAFHTPVLQLGLSIRSAGAMLRGGIPRGSCLLGLPLRVAADFRMHGAPAQASEMLALRHGEELEIGTRQASEVLSLAIAETTLDRAFRAILGEPLEHWRRNDRLALDGPALAPVLARYLAGSLKPGIEAASCRDLRRLQSLENTLIERVVRAVGKPQVESNRVGRWHLAGKAEEHLRAHADQPLCVPDLCEAVGVNERTLFLGFGERYGISPKAYLKHLRLNLARRELLNPAPTTRVTEVATRYCFFQFGQFSMEYRGLFGEYPRDTLRKGLHLKPVPAGTDGTGPAPAADTGPP